MSINQLIAGGIQLPRFESPMNMMAQLSQLEAAREANELRRMQMAQLQQKTQQEEMFRQGIQQLGPDASQADVARLLMRFPDTLVAGVDMRRQAQQREAFERMYGGGMVRPPAPVGPSTETLPPQAAPAGIAPMGAAPMGAAPTEFARRNPESIRQEMFGLSRFKGIPEADARMKVLELELSEAMKTHTVGGRVVTGSGEVRFQTPSELTELEEQIQALVDKGVPMTDSRIVSRQAKIAKLVSHPTAAQMLVNTYTPASEAAQSDFIKTSTEAYKNLRFAPQTLQSIEDAKALVPQARGFMGAGGEPLLAVASFLKNRLGIGVNTEGVTSAEQLRALLFQGVLDNLRSVDAQPTQQQQIALQQAIGRIGSDPDALPRILDVYGDRIRRRVELYNKDVISAEKRGVKFPFDPVIQLPEIGAAQAPASRGLVPEPETPARTAPVSDLSADELRRMKPTKSLVGRDRQAYEAAIAAPGNPDADAVLRQLRQRKLIQ